MYTCIEDFATSDGTRYYEGDMISGDAYAYLQPSERENFERSVTKQ